MWSLPTCSLKSGDWAHSKMEKLGSQPIYEAVRAAWMQGRSAEGRVPAPPPSPGGRLDVCGTTADHVRRSGEPAERQRMCGADACKQYYIYKTGWPQAVSFRGEGGEGGRRGAEGGKAVETTKMRLRTSTPPTPTPQKKHPCFIASPNARAQVSAGPSRTSQPVTARYSP